MSFVYEIGFFTSLALAQVFQSRVGQVLVECSIVILLTELYKWGRVGKIVCRARGIS